MKNINKQLISCFILLITITQLANAQHKKTTTNNFRITVDVSDIKPAPTTVYLLYFFTGEDGKWATKSDSLKVKSGTVTFTGGIAEPTLGILQTKLLDVSGRFCISRGIIKIKAKKDITELHVTGSAYEPDFEDLYVKKEESEKKMAVVAEEFNKLMKSKDTVKAMVVRDQYGNLGETSANEIWKAYVLTHAKTSALSLFALNMYKSYSNVEQLDSLYNLLSPVFKKLPTAVALKKGIEQVQSLTIGKIAPAFTQPDTSGKMIPLTSFRGRYVLVDFWASWCHPCRGESPYLIKAFDKFKDKNFTILSISLDDKATRTAWINAIHKDGVGGWSQVSDLMGWKNAASTKYGITAIPQNYLLDPSGKIIATNLRGDDLDKQLTELIKM